MPHVTSRSHDSWRPRPSSRNDVAVRLAHADCSPVCGPHPPPPLRPPSALRRLWVRNCGGRLLQLTRGAGQPTLQRVRDRWQERPHCQGSVLVRHGGHAEGGASVDRAHHGAVTPALVPDPELSGGCSEVDHRWRRGRGRVELSTRHAEKPHGAGSEDSEPETLDVHRPRVVDARRAGLEAAKLEMAEGSGGRSDGGRRHGVPLTRGGTAPVDAESRVRRKLSQYISMSFDSNTRGEVGAGPDWRS